MTDEDKSGSEQETSDKETTTQPEPTLDDVIAEFQPSAPSPQQAPAQPTPSAETHEAKPEVPDPYDDQQFRSWAEKVQQEDNALKSQVRELTEKLSKYEQQQQQNRVEADIKATVNEINQELKADPDFIEASLEMLARKKPGFQQIWNNRQNNPQAWEKAKRAAKADIQKTLSVKQDQGLVESQQAVEASQRQSAAGESESRSPVEEALANAKTQGEFDRIWAQLRQG